MPARVQARCNRKRRAVLGCAGNACEGAGDPVAGAIGRDAQCSKGCAGSACAGAGGALRCEQPIGRRWVGREAHFATQRTHAQDPLLRPRDDGVPGARPVRVFVEHRARFRGPACVHCRHGVGGCGWRANARPLSHSLAYSLRSVTWSAWSPTHSLTRSPARSLAR